MYHGSEKLKENLEPETETPRIDPRLKTGLEVARWTASKAAQGSGYVGNSAEIHLLCLETLDDIALYD
jgi:hypothetical protein